MDIWAWTYSKEDQLIEAGENRLVEIMRELPSLCCADEHEKVDAVYPEALALAKKSNDKWVEVFIRHWYLQSQVLKRNNAKGMLNNAIELLDISHQDNAKDCPQRICAVQDLSNCYGVADGPGYTDERIAVCNEALKEIDPTWTCFVCISTEYLHALLDEERYEFALSESLRFQKECYQYQEDEMNSLNDLNNVEARAFIRLNRAEEAVELLQSKPVKSNDGSQGKRTKLLLCLAFAHLGRFEDVKQNMFAFDQILKSHTYYNDWAEIQYLSINNGYSQFDDSLSYYLRLTSHNLIEHGSFRCAVMQLSFLFDLAIKHDCLFSAKLALQKLGEIIPELNKDLGASKQAEERRSKLTIALKQHSIKEFSDIDSLLSYDFESKDSYIESLIAFVEKSPKNLIAISKLADQYTAFLLKDKGLELLTAAYKNNQYDDDTCYAYGRFLLKKYGRNKFFAVFDERIEDKKSLDQLPSLLWLYGHANKDSDTSKAIYYFKAYTQQSPSDENSLFSLAWLYCDTEDYAESITVWNKLIELNPQQTHYQWDKLIPSTLSENWVEVRNVCSKLDIEIESQKGQVIKNMGVCQIEFEEQDGSRNLFYAKRTGPVTATITEIKRIEETQKFNHEVVFDPAPLNQLDQQDDEGNACDKDGIYYYRYKAYRTQRAPIYECYAIDGVHPGEEQLNQLEKKLEQTNFIFNQRSNEDYRIYYDEGDKTHETLGLYAYILTTQEQDKHTLHALLQTFNNEQKHPLIWPALLEKLALVDELKKQADIEEFYELY